MKRIAIMICVRDRPTEISMLLQSLLGQTYQEFDIYISDDCSGTPLQNYHFFNIMTNQLRLRGHYVHFSVCPFSHGVSKNRRRLVEIVEKSGFDYELYCRLDDDCWIENDFLERMVKVIDAGYDLASGTNPPAIWPGFKRDPTHLHGVANRLIFDQIGNIIWNGDDHGMLYTHSAVLPMSHFRSNAVYKSDLHKKSREFFGKDLYDNRLSKSGFREEAVMSIRLLVMGAKLGCDTGAIAWHQQTQSGGQRFADSNELFLLNEQIFLDEVKELFNEHGDFAKKYLDKIGAKTWMPGNEEIMKETNCRLIR